MATTSRPPRFYLCISDSKVLSMYNQMPRRRLRKALKEVKVDVKVFGASLAEPTDTRESRLPKTPWVPSESTSVTLNPRPTCR
ncbi:DUF7019 family protein [Wenjunlia tyrosinilytica]|uniref:Uncharacterized protein n=1 Tax=Wenjunlia tyrosinilytica TaxID=1544741 RepID=A0A917ZXS4_9ACTN|nr:hypothetical protein [Wenjunlia tyrosinilytica]GGP00055.1 hypothetical protein GCM10012280_67910 [Wenjunlia tyrosinilytica]